MWTAVEKQRQDSDWVSVARLVQSVCFAMFFLPCYINRMAVGGEAGPSCRRGVGDAAAVCRVLPDGESPSHLLITVVPQTQPANNCPPTATGWKLHQAGADGERGERARERTTQPHSQPEQTGLN